MDQDFAGGAHAEPPGQCLRHARRPGYPVPRLAHFTGSTELSSSRPFYFYLLPDTKAVEANDHDRAYYDAWRTWQAGEVSAAWDEDLKQFVIPYTNYCHNYKGTWEKGWHSRLVIANGSGQPVKYLFHHNTDFNCLVDAAGKRSNYHDQTVEKVLRSHEKLEIWLEDLYGWPKKLVSAMEGNLLVSPVPVEAHKETTVTFDVLPNDK